MTALVRTVLLKLYWKQGVGALVFLALVVRVLRSRRVA